MIDPRGRVERDRSVVIGTAEVISALRAHEFAVVAGEAVAACGTDLAVVVDGEIARPRGIMLREIPLLVGNIIRVESTGTLRQHG